MPYFIQNFVIDKYVRQALEEDIGPGDLTVDSIIKQDRILRAKLTTRTDGIVAGLDVFRRVFQTLDPDMKFGTLSYDGDRITKGQDLAIVEGSARAILMGERTALNFIQRMSAIATITNQYQEAIKPYSAKITDTRKTTPNFRVFEKYAVRVGGGSPHRFGLFDCIMIKDNHIEIAGSITKAVELVRQGLSHTTKIEVETETLDQVKEALNLGVDVIMLDNMTIDQMKNAVQIIGKKAIIEASGTIALEGINKVASTGVNYISTSAITARAGSLDIGLDI